MLPRSHPSERIHPDCPSELHRQVDAMLACSLASQGIMAGETMIDLVKRHCPEVFDLVAAEGFELRCDLVENSHKALCRGKLSYQIRKRPTH